MPLGAVCTATGSSKLVVAVALAAFNAPTIFGYALGAGTTSPFSGTWVCSSIAKVVVVAAVIRVVTAIATPLDQTKLLPDLRHVYFFPEEIVVLPALLHAPPGLTAAFTAIEGRRIDRATIDKYAMGFLFMIEDYVIREWMQRILAVCRVVPLSAPAKLISSVEVRQLPVLRTWLSGRASPCQGEGREFESRRPLE